MNLQSPYSYILPLFQKVLSYHFLSAVWTHLYFFSFRIFIFKSSRRMFSSTLAGAPVIKSCPLFVLGKGITSFMEFSFNIAISHLSIPKASPPCGGTPYFNTSRKNPNLSSSSSLLNPSFSNTFSCNSSSCILILPPPISS